MAKTKANLGPLFEDNQLPDHSGNHVITDRNGKLWRIDVGAGIMRPVTIEKPALRRANAKPRSKRR
jgi:hypothetical protein